MSARGDRRLRVVIDARLAPGRAGGVESVITGLADGLSGLDGEDESYAFVVREGAADWLRPYIRGRAELIVEPGFVDVSTTRGRRARRAIGDAMPVTRLLWRSLAGTRRGAGPTGDRFIDSLSPDVVHFPLQRGCLVDVPSIYHPHDLQHVHLPQFFTPEEREKRDTWYRTLAQRAAMVAVASTWTKRDVERYLQLDPARVRVVPWAPPTSAGGGTSTPTATVVDRWQLPERYVLYPAQTWPHKNHVSLLAALNRLASDGVVVPLVATGAKTDYFEDLRELVAGLGLADQVTWTGYVPSADLRGIYRGASAVVIPSRFEAVSAPLWEAFAEGVPAACSNVTSLPDQAGDAAILFDPDDALAIASAIKTLWTDDATRTRLVAAGRKRVAEFTWDRTARTFRAHYRRLARRPLSAEDTDLLTARPPL